MVHFGQTINVNDIPERTAYTPVQPGTYYGMIMSAEEKPNGPNSKDPNGSQIVLDIEITEGEFQGKKLVERLNLKNASDKAREIAFQTLGEIIRAVGKVTVSSTDDLQGKRFMMEVVVEPGRPYAAKNPDGTVQLDEHGKAVMKDGSPQNRIKKYLPVAGAATAQGTPAGNAGAASAPWKR